MDATLDEFKSLIKTMTERDGDCNILAKYYLIIYNVSNIKRPTFSVGLMFLFIDLPCQCQELA